MEVLVKSQQIIFIAKVLIVLSGLSISSVLMAGEPFMLVSEEEYQMQLGQKGESRKRMKFKTRALFSSDEDSPLITINSPTVTSGLYSPIRIEINFKASDDAVIQVDSLKVLYGWLKLDVTDRIRRHAQISHSGIIAENVQLPVGEHNITIEIKDSRKRSADKDVSFEVLTKE